MSNPLSITAVAGDSHRVLLQIEGPDGVWQLPVPKEQASALAEQLMKLTRESSDQSQDLHRFVEHAMITMPSGRLWMGAMPGDDIPTDATPRHAVDVDAFELSMIPITQGLWFHVMGTNPSEDTGVRKPVTHVSWMESVLFCNRLSKVLDLTAAYVTGVTVPFNQTATADCLQRLNGNMLQELEMIYTLLVLTRLIRSVGCWSMRWNPCLKLEKYNCGVSTT